MFCLAILDRWYARNIDIDQFTIVRKTLGPHFFPIEISKETPGKHGPVKLTHNCCHRKETTPLIELSPLNGLYMAVYYEMYLTL